MTQETPQIIGRECRFAIHIPENHLNGTPDYHFVKEQIHYSDGTIVPNVRLIKDFKRPVWVVRNNRRVYQDKREWEEKENLVCKEVTQSKMRDEIARLLDKAWTKDHYKKLASSPYLYGTDISSTSLLKKAYMDKYPDLNTPYSVAGFDIETDVVNGTEDPIMSSVIFKNKIHLSVDKKFIYGLSLVDQRFIQAFNKYILDYINEYNIKNEGKHRIDTEYDITLHIAENPLDMFTTQFKVIHEWKPDFLAIWNMDFDIPKVMAAIVKYGGNPADILCDPSVPEEFRICEYKQGQKKKVTASGKVQPINSAAQWHTLYLTASFYVIDAMCTYKHLRLGEQEEASYSLDYILNLRLGLRKLKFKEADEYTGLRWHQFMQTNFKIEYMVYNIFDSLSMLALDSKTKDLGYTLPSFSATTDFWNFKSQPRRIADALHFYFLDNNCVLGTVGYAIKKVDKPEDPDADIEVNPDGDDDDEDADDPDAKTLDRKGWIVTLPAHMSVLGLACILEDPSIKTNIRTHVFDSDCSSAYPSATSVANVSKITTICEIISIESIEESVFRMQNLNALLGPVNSNEYCQVMFNLPRSEELLQAFLSSTEN